MAGLTKLAIESSLDRQSEVVSTGFGFRLEGRIPFQLPAVAGQMLPATGFTQPYAVLGLDRSDVGLGWSWPTGEVC